MRCLDDCHTYELDTFMGTGTMQGVSPCRNCGTDPESKIGFYRMDPDGSKFDGVTNEEVLRVLIHRLEFLNRDWMGGKFKCRENSLAITKLEEALMWLEKRTADRVARGVEGTHEK